MLGGLDRSEIEVDGKRHDAGPFETQLLELSAVVVRHSKRNIDAPDQRRNLLPADERQAKKTRIVVGEERRRRHVVVLEDAPAPERAKGGGHRRRQRIVKNSYVALACGRVAEVPHISVERVVDRERVEFGVMALVPQQIADVTGAVANRVALVSRRQPLVDNHQLSTTVGSAL